jgi:hypothetical protein
VHSTNRRARRAQGRRGWRWIGAVAAASMMAVACTEGGRSEYSVDGDTGAAAPATVPDQSTADMVGTDSTLGTGGRTGEPAMAGDTAGARARARDSSGQAPLR